MSEPIVELSALTKVFGRGRHAATAVDGVSLTLGRGESLGIVGESGSGKSTTAKMVIGLERPSAGRIVVEGHDWTRPARRVAERRRRGRTVQIVFQDPYTSLDRRQTVADCLAEVVRLHFGSTRAETARRVGELADLVGLDARQLAARPRALSGGQRQRVAIARALAAEPGVVILDEAVSALDMSIQAQILNLLDDIRRDSGVSYLFITHDLAVVRQVTDSVIVMRHGRIVEQGATAAVLDAPRDPYTRLLRDSVPRPGWDPSAVPARGGTQ
ncbi:ABC transporter ATP-binding protein [Streptomyces endophyticus]|uniref:ATP-binding cassette domain-containing protein n=1 Tax=Streptomyces endophyticus TaxID=714166 RepID=A0ABU6F9Q3_9ACTN|nr:ATP-binding cassette domain-containing protein [Streptomyces endophyticus]MEB8340761.1 ATP-binding cassette domain-containing protein [Streptomyces endophyticus]